MTFTLMHTARLHIDSCKCKHYFIVKGAKMAATGVAAPSRLTQRKPFSEINRMDSSHQGNAKEPLRAKATLAGGKAPVGAKPKSNSQSSHRPRSLLKDNQQLRTKVVPAGREQVWINSFFVRDSIYATACICYRPSVCLPVCTQVDQWKTVEVRIMQLSPLSSPMTPVSSWLTSLRNSKGNIGSEGTK